MSNLFDMMRSTVQFASASGAASKIQLDGVSKYALVTDFWTAAEITARTPGPVTVLAGVNSTDTNHYFLATKTSNSLGLVECRKLSSLSLMRVRNGGTNRVDVRWGVASGEYVVGASLTPPDRTGGGYINGSSTTTSFPSGGTSWTGASRSLEIGVKNESYTNMTLGPFAVLHVEMSAANHSIANTHIASLRLSSSIDSL